MRELIVDSFAGGGGASLGIELALGRGPDVAINHDEAAIVMHAANHPRTKHFTEDVWKASPRQVTRGRKVGLLWASPDCKHFSRAKGGKPVEKKIRSLAWVVCKWAAEVSPRLIVLENVREFEDWGPLVPRWDCPACEWRGTEGQTTLARHGKRACPRCDSKRLRPTELLVPDPKRKGLTFKRFVGRLRGLGYVVERKALNAADFGAPTHRRRLFLIARNDGEPITWPEPTHGDPKKIAAADGGLFAVEPLAPWRTAAECIDWSIPCPSIFDRKRPLAEKTMRRIALGIKRYVLDNATPFIVDMQRDNRSRGTDEPCGTVTTQHNRFNVVSPLVMPLTHNGERRCHESTEPLPTITTAKRGEFGIVTPYLVPRYGERPGQEPRSAPITEPMPTVTQTANGGMLVTPHLTKFRNNSVGSGIDEPTPTITANSYIKRPGGSAPIGLVSAFIAKHFGGVVGVPAETPLPTTLTQGRQNQLVAANLVHLNNHTGPTSINEPTNTVTGGGLHAALVYSFLIRYFGTAIGQHVTEPLFTVTGKDRFGLVTVSINGEPYVIVDIGMRMLTPRELARAQGFPNDYKLTGTNTDQVARIGNSVCPPVARAIVEANYANELAAV